MTYEEFLKKVIEKGIKAAKKDYKRPDQKAILKGSIAGFNACSKKIPEQLAILLEKARIRTMKLMDNSPKTKKELNKYWEARGYEIEIEWVCNVISASLMNQGKPIIVNPTARGVTVASKIVGVENEKEK